MLTRVFFIVAILVTAGWVHGRWVDRWGPSPAAAESAASLGLLPVQFGDWVGRDISPEESQIVFKPTTPQIVRRYVNRLDGTTVCLLLTCGRPAGMIVDHTPKTCYTYFGFEEVGLGKRVAVPAESGQAAEFFAHTFVKATPAFTSRVRVFWAWGDRDTWSFPDRPRIHFAGKPVLFKAYVTREMVSDDEPIADDPATPFLRAVLPELQKCLNGQAQN